jgi:NAD(P)-dependent dehydrogenase (short-subunit alcohol dehydrogenase family)
MLDGKVVLVNGGTQGVGGAVARAAVREGADVVITGRRADTGTRLAAELQTLGRQVRFVQADLTDPLAARASVTSTVAAFGRIDGLCNAAGLTTRGTLIDTTPELFDAHIAVNLRGPFFAMQAAVEDMLERGTQGSIVNIGSIASHGGQGYLAPYVAAKAGLAGLTRNAAYAHRWDRIRINCLNIGWTESEGEAQTQRQFHDAGQDWAVEAAKKVPMGKLGQPLEIAEAVVLLLSPRSGVVTGSVIDWDQIVIGGHD